ncbi:Teneurin-4 [Saguinus oedipus]|uniref:Teneurin-4 n=1 Tax=Saguinus oedipus TaxID=9490 RepID=A0ABQ9UVE1_SAGOE|nr:Teneurin-4 [Saguinus oedipus]
MYNLPVPSSVVLLRPPWLLLQPRGSTQLAAADRRVCVLDHPGGLQNHPRLRTPPPPLSHAHTPNQHHAASINSLNRGNFTPRSNPSPAPTDHSLSGEPPAGGAQEPAHAQDNWLLNSNIPLETRLGRAGSQARAEAFGVRCTV